MKSLVFVALATFVTKDLVLAQQSAYKGVDPVKDMKKFACDDVKIEKVNFDFCSSENPRRHGHEKIYDEEMKKVERINNGRFLKYTNCYIRVNENGRSKTFYDIKDTKPVCIPKISSGPQFCETPEDTVRLLGPYCSDTKGGNLTENCKIVLHHKFDLKGIDEDFVANDTRRMCVCNDKGCGHVLAMIEKKDWTPFSDQEKAHNIEQIKSVLKSKAPECDDVAVKDVSATKNNIHMYVAMSSTKCPIIIESPISQEHCPPWKVRGVEQIEITEMNGKKRIIGSVCVKRAPQGSNSAPNKEGNAKR